MKVVIKIEFYERTLTYQLFRNSGEAKKDLNNAFRDPSNQARSWNIGTTIKSFEFPA